MALLTVGVVGDLHAGTYPVARPAAKKVDSVDVVGDGCAS